MSGHLPPVPRAYAARATFAVLAGDDLLDIHPLAARFSKRDRAAERARRNSPQLRRPDRARQARGFGGVQ